MYIDNVINQVIERHLLAELPLKLEGDFGINEQALRSMLEDEDYQAIEDEKRRLEGEIKGLEACHDALR